MRNACKRKIERTENRDGIVDSVRYPHCRFNEKKDFIEYAYLQIYNNSSVLSIFYRLIRVLYFYSVLCRMSRTPRGCYIK